MLKGTKAIGMLAAGIVLYTGMTVSATGTGNAPVPSAGVGEILEAKLQEGGLSGGCGRSQGGKKSGLWLQQPGDC